MIFTGIISQYDNKHPNLIIMGDVNIQDEDEDDNNIQNYRDIIDTFGYYQVVCIPTHQDGHTLDTYWYQKTIMLSLLTLNRDIKFQIITL